MMKMDISPTAPSAAMEWRSYCAETTAAAGPALLHVSICTQGRFLLLIPSLPPTFRSYCADCLNILVGEGTFDSLKDLDPWICYQCQPHQPHGSLVPREDWSIRVQELFANNSGMAFVSPSHVVIMILK